MKKTLGTVLVITVMAVAMFSAVGPASAMSETRRGPGNGGYGNGANPAGLLSPYMIDAMASLFELEPAELTARLEAGETCYTIALEKGYSAEEIADLFANAQSAATKLAAADGVTLQPQKGMGLGVQVRLQDGTCDGTGTCLQTDGTFGLGMGVNGGGRGTRGGR
ncbi:MAG: hypothetical protein H8E29_17050 [Anaerolineales bacterium]|uniref:LysM domain-containing protein n=1 Tax=Candidatus Desulfolinea nitratireducens TaxID=2841698 RepID=A0A8J6NJI5_9CHLR|nr:hypothetical protein [Candidatus Desulfolinea nitratireducens]